MKDELKTVQTERGNNYGSFSDHMIAVENIMKELKNVNRAKNDGVLEWPKGFETAMFYIASKIVRMSTDPYHVDSTLDTSSYADLWLQEIRKRKGLDDDNIPM